MTQQDKEKANFSSILSKLPEGKLFAAYQRITQKMTECETYV